MKIESLGVTFPSREVTNNEVMNEIRALSKQFAGNIDPLLQRLRAGLAKSGIQTRRWCGPNETPLSVTLSACRKALSGLPSGEKPDLLIYASVYLELIEPATANLIAHELGLDEVECFDLKEACDGWMKAIKVAQALLSTGSYRRIMIVNAEFSMTPGFALYPALFDLRTPEQLDHRLPTFTIGEAATATIVTGESDAWPMTNVTRNNLYDLCTVPPSWYGVSGHVLSSELVGKDGGGCFTSWASLLTGNGIPLAVETFKRSGIDPTKVDILFTHGSSRRDWAKIASQIGLLDKLYDMHVRYGNVVSAAVPAAMGLAIEEGQLCRGSRVAVLVASAGMSFSTTSFVF